MKKEWKMKGLKKSLGDTTNGKYEWEMARENRK
jgi:hypothetical protein